MRRARARARRAARSRRRHHLARGRVAVVVVVRVDRELGRRARPEQAQVLGMRGSPPPARRSSRDAGSGRARGRSPPSPGAGRGETSRTPQPRRSRSVRDQVEELDLPGEVDALHRLVQHQQVGLAQPGRAPAARAAARRRRARTAAARRARPAPTSASSALDVRVGRSPSASGSARTVSGRPRSMREALRHVADDAGPAARGSCRRPGCCRPSSTRTSVVLPAPLGPISVTISPRRHADVDVVQHHAPAAAQHQALCLDQGASTSGRHCASLRWQLGQRPASSIVRCSMR